MPEVRRDATCRLFSHEHPHFVKSIESGKPDAFASHNRRDCSILGRDLTNHHRVAAGTAVILTVRSRSNGSAVCRNILSVDFLQPDICTTKCRNFRSALTHGRPPIKTQAEVWALRPGPGLFRNGNHPEMEFSQVSLTNHDAVAPEVPPGCLLQFLNAEASLMMHRSGPLSSSCHEPRTSSGSFAFFIKSKGD